jgi:hypothetical protein
MVAALGAIAANAAAGGCWVASRGAARPSMPTWMLVSGLVMTGLLVISSNVFDFEAAYLLIFLVMGLGGAITQLLMPVRQVWVCGSGALVFSLFLLNRYQEGSITAENVASGLFAVVIVMVPVAALGAQLAWRLSGRGNAADAVQPELPSARVQ